MINLDDKGKWNRQDLAIIDFGMSIDTDKTNKCQKGGTPGYASWEVLRGTADLRSDVRGFKVILRALLAKDRFTAECFMHEEQTTDEIDDFRKNGDYGVLWRALKDEVIIFFVTG